MSDEVVIRFARVDDLEPVLKSKLISESFHFTGKYPQNQLISPLK